MSQANQPARAEAQPRAEKLSDAKTSLRVNELDLLRFIAAFMVVMFHYGFRGHAADGYSLLSLPTYATVSKYGYLGVELFFMISGFVILMTASSGSFKKFVISRIVRLYPAFWACCTITFIAILIVGDKRFTATFGQYLINLTMLNEFFGIRSIDGVYWSLAVEIHFYLLVALVLLAGQIRHALWFLVAWLAISILMDVLPKDINFMPRLRSMFIVDSAYYFIAGATCYLVRANGASILKSMVILLAWLMGTWTSIQSLAGLEAHYQTTINPLVVGLLIALFFVVVLLMSFRQTGFLAKRRWITLGALTYPLYLLHQNLGYLNFNYWYGSVNEYILLWSTIVGMLAMAFFVHLQVEARWSAPLKTFLDKLSQKLAKYEPQPAQP